MDRFARCGVGRKGRGVAVAGQHGEQDGHSGAAEFARRLPQGGDRRHQQTGELHVVEADDRHVARHIQTAVAQRFEHADREVIAGGEHGGWRELARGQLRRGHLAEAAVIGAEQHERRVKRDAGFVERAPIAFVALAHGEERLRPGDMGDSRMAGVDQMPGGQIAALAIVDEYPRHIDAWHVLVDQHDVAALADQLPERAVVGTVGCEDQAVEMAGIEPAQIERFTFETVARDAQREAEAAFRGGFFDGVGELGKKRIGDIGHREADRFAAAEAQTSREAVLPIVECDHGVVDAFFRFRRQRERTVQVARDSGLGHVGQFGDVADR